MKIRRDVGRLATLSNVAGRLGSRHNQAMRLLAMLALAQTLLACGSRANPSAAAGGAKQMPAAAAQPGTNAGGTAAAPAATRGAPMTSPGATATAGQAAVTPAPAAPAPSQPSTPAPVDSASMPMAEPGAATPSAPSADPMPSPGCQGGSLAPGRTTVSIQSSGGNRMWIQYVPASYDGTKPVAMMVDLHAYSVDATFSENSSGFRPLADTEGYIYLAPYGTGNMWESVGDSDEKFIRDMVNDVAAKGCIDLKRVYASGCSNGGAFSFLLMCTAEDIFAAVAPMCGTAFFDLDTGCMLDRPVSMMLIIGRQDTLNCWEGEGMVLNAPNVPGGTRVPCAKTVQAKLTAKYHCKGDIQMQGDCEIVGECDQGTEVAICGSATGHVVYTANTARDTWDFLKKFYKP